MQLHLDTTFGFDGMALVGALAHLGVDMRPILEALQGFDLPCRLQGVQRGPAGPGFRLVPVKEALPSDGLWPANGLSAALEALPLPPTARKQAETALHLLLEAQAQAHGVRPEGLAFAAGEGVAVLLSLAAACWGLELARKALGITRITAAPLPWQSGMLRSSQGACPLPSPATALLLRGLPLRKADESPETSGEILPADGAALAHVLPDAFDTPEGTVRGLGTGYRPTTEDAWLRIWLVEEETTEEESPDAQRTGGDEQIAQLETHLDHLTGEELGLALEILAAMPKQPGSAQHAGAIRQRGAHGLLSLQLCGSVHALRMRLVVFLQLLRTLSAKDEVRAILHQKLGVAGLDKASKRRRQAAVDKTRFLHMVFRIIHLRPGDGIENHVGAGGIQPFRKKGIVQQIALLPPQSFHAPATFCQDAHQRLPQQTRCAA